MRILHVADLHLRWFEWVKTNATAFDLLVIAGDLQDPFSNASGAEQGRRCREWLLSLETPTIVVSGNHDYYAPLGSMSGDSLEPGAQWLRNLSGRGSILAVDGESVNFPPSNPTAKISSVGWAQKPDWSADTDILVTHAPPSGVDVAIEQGGTRDMGDSELWRALREKTAPRLVLAGHVHQGRSNWSRWPFGDASRRSTILVTGYDDSAPEPQRWEIDLAASRARWIGEQQITIEI